MFWQVKRAGNILILVGLLCAGSVWGQYVGSGSSVFTFMDLPVSSRLNELGGSNVSIQDGDVQSSVAWRADR